MSAGALRKAVAAPPKDDRSPPELLARLREPRARAPGELSVEDAERRLKSIEVGYVATANGDGENVDADLTREKLRVLREWLPSDAAYLLMGSPTPAPASARTPSPALEPGAWSALLQRYEKNRAHLSRVREWLPGDLTVAVADRRRRYIETIKSSNASKASAMLRKLDCQIMRVLTMDAGIAKARMRKARVPWHDIPSQPSAVHHICVGKLGANRKYISVADAATLVRVLHLARA